MRYYALVFLLLSFSANTLSAKDFPISSIPQHPAIGDFDSFSLECMNKSTRTIDREDIDTSNSTVTLSIHGLKPQVHEITNFSWTVNTFKDRFDIPKAHLSLMSIEWIDRNGKKVGLFYDLTRWYSRHTDYGELWWCANY